MFFRIDHQDSIVSLVVLLTINLINNVINQLLHACDLKTSYIIEIKSRHLFSFVLRPPHHCISFDRLRSIWELLGLLELEVVAVAFVAVVAIVVVVVVAAVD